MKYKVVIFGVKDTTAEIVTFIQEKICPVDLVVTIHPDVLSGNQVSGYQGLGFDGKVWNPCIRNPFLWTEG